MKASAATPRADAAEVGIGTLIVFIATILTAAVAASVLINTSNSLQEKASRTGSEATEQVANNLVVQTVEGHADATGSNLAAVNVTVSLAAGSRHVDLSQIVIRISNATAVRQLVYSTAAGNATFTATALRDADSSFNDTTPVMTTGDLVSINLDLSSSGANLGAPPRSSLDLILQPEVGVRVQAELRVPPTMNPSAVVLLR
ncbi:MAG TPA: hypothetical protein VGR28_12725 [Candidatus Thermoplasmatota archaeon]|jgi:flagellin FlaB|nr:hypothetical protein [Candidatus Thermoplasmatota archaeon]